MNCILRIEEYLYIVFPKSVTMVREMVNLGDCEFRLEYVEKILFVEKKEHFSDYTDLSELSDEIENA